MAFFDLFSKNKNLLYTDFSSVIADMHSHLIPGIDDGCKDMEESAEVIKKLFHLGFRKIITTPHVISDSYNNSRETILEGFARLNNAAKNLGLPIELKAGAEYLIDDKFSERFSQGNVILIADKYILIELPFIQEPDSLNTVIFQIQSNACKVILAHPERYSFWYNNPSRYFELHERGVLFQLNILSLTNHYSPLVRKTAEFLIKENLIDFIGTDAHNTGFFDNVSKCFKSKHLHKLLGSGKLLNSSL